MAVLAVAGIGALGSSALGLGWQAGWLIGSAVGNSLFGPKMPDQEGPRLQDLSVSSSAYGAPIPKAYGSMRTNGNVIWAPDLIEEKKTETQGGKGGGGVKTTTYSYYANFAIAFGEGPADAVVRIWFDTTLVYDSSGTTNFSRIDGLDFRFYPGSEDQLPDPLIESYEGEGNVPAHRGLCYIVFERLPLGDYGNRIPSITAEIAYSTEDVKPYLVTENYPAGVLPTGRMAPDYARNRLYVQGTDNRIYRLNAQTMQVERQGSFVYPSTLNSLQVGPDGNLIASEYYVDTYGYTINYRINPTTLAPIATTDPIQNLIFDNRTAKKWIFVPVVAGSTVKYFAVNANPNIYGAVLDIYDYDSMELIYTRVFTNANYSMYGVGGAKPITTGIGGGSFYAFICEGARTDIDVHSFTIKRNTATETGWLVTSSVTDSISAAEAGGDEIYTLFNITFGEDVDYEDPYDGGIVFSELVKTDSGSTASVSFKWVPDVGVVWTGPPRGPVRHNNWATQRIATSDFSTFSILNTATNVITESQGWDDVIPNRLGGYGDTTYNGNENSIVTLDQVNDVTIKIFINRKNALSGSLESIVTSLCLDAGLSLSDIDASELSDISVPGYVVSRTMTLRNALEPLASSFFFDVVESDGVLKFKLRGSNSVATITDDFLLLRGETGSRIEERRAMEVELPSRVSVVYSDIDTDYGQGTQSAQRIATTNSSRNNVNLELPMALDGTTARRIAQKALASAWNGRTSFDFSTTIDFLKLDPTDVIDVYLDSGTTYKIRLTDLEVGADYSVNLKGVSEYAASYQSDVEGASSEGFTPQVVVKDIATQTILPDMPLLQDVDDLAGTGTRVYSLTTGFDYVNWSGAVTFKSGDGGTTWDRVSAADEALPWGIAINVLGEPDSPFKTDEENTLIVSMEAGEQELSSITQLQMLNNGNPALLLKANGEPEIIQFRDVTFNADNTVTLSGLLRGRRGTDVFTSGHAAGDIFVLLTQAQIDAFSLPLDDINDPIEIKAVPVGVGFDSVPFDTRVYSGRDMKPYAPVNFSATLEGDSSVTLSWFRRTRIGGGLEDGLGAVPLSETTELYDVEILDGSGGVLRSYVDITSPTVSYSALDYAADFPSGTNTLTFRVYQKSEIVGRGFPGEEIVEVL